MALPISVISQAVTALLVLRAMSRLDEEYGLSFRKICIHKTNLLEILTMGIPISIQSMAYPIINYCGCWHVVSRGLFMWYRHLILPT